MNQTYIDTIQSANVLLQQGDFENAMEKLHKALELAEFTEQKIDIYNTIGRVNLTTNHIQHAVDSFKKSLSLHQELSEETAEILATNRAAILNNLGSIYLQNDVKQSIAYHNEALNVFQKAAAENPAEFLMHLANTHFSLGEAFYNKGDLYQARKNYRTAIETYAKIENPNDDIVKPLVANAHYSLGNIANDENNTTTARDNLVKALFIYQELTEKSPQSFRPLLAATNNNLAVVAKLTDKYGDSIRYYLATLEQYEILITEDRDVFLPYYAATLNNLGIVYTQKHEVRDDLGVIESSGYTGFGTLSVGNFSDEKKDEEAKNDKLNAIKYYLQALDAYHELSQTEPELYIPYTATTMHNLGILYDENKEYKDAQKYYKDALKIRKELAEQDAMAFDADVCVTLLNMVTMNQSLMEQNADISYKSISLGLLEEAKSRVEKYTDNRPIIKSMRSDITYYTEYYKNVDEKYLDILKVFGEIDELTEKISENINPGLKLAYQTQIHNILLNLFKKYPDNKRVKDEVLKSYVDYSWLAIRTNDLKLAKSLLDNGLQLDENAPLLKTNLAHYHLLKNEKDASDVLYNALKNDKSDDFGKIIEEDLETLKKDGVLN